MIDEIVNDLVVHRSNRVVSPPIRFGDTVKSDNIVYSAGHSVEATIRRHGQTVSSVTGVDGCIHILASVGQHSGSCHWTSVCADISCWIAMRKQS